MTHPRAVPGLERVTVALLLCFVASLQISIAAANILLALMLVCWIAMLVQEKTVPSVPRFFWPARSRTAPSRCSSLPSPSTRARASSTTSSLSCFVIVPAVYHIARGERAAVVIDVIVSVGAASAAFGIIQYGLLHYDNLGRRPEGAMSHYMTYSGLLMLVICAAAARLIFGRRDRTWPALVMPALVVALALTLGRSAWIGASRRRRAAPRPQGFPADGAPAGIHRGPVRHCAGDGDQPGEVDLRRRRIRPTRIGSR